MIKTAKKYTPPESPYKNLALAIVERAVYDYRIAMQSRERSAIKELRKFFTSDWFSLLCDIDGEMIIRTIDKEDVA